MPPPELSIRYGGLTWELARLWIDDAVPANAETWLIAQGVRWIVRERPDVRYLVSYADPSAGHSGCIYRAANWRYDGMTDERRKTARRDAHQGSKRFGRASHVPKGEEVEMLPRVSKHRFVYALPEVHRKSTLKTAEFRLV